MGIYGNEYFINEGSEILRYVYNIDRPNLNDIIFFNNNGVENAIINIKGIGNCRYRCEALIFNKKNYIFGMIKNNIFKVPGGSIDKNETPEEAAQRETNEEALMLISNIIYSGNYAYILKDYNRWVKENMPSNIRWKAYYTEIFTCQYKGKYKEEVNDVDKDEIYDKGKWYNVNDIIDYCNEAQKLAINNYISKQHEI